MNHLIVVDADFLSSFLKIGRLYLIPQFYQVENVVIAPAVYREVALTRLVSNLSAHMWVQIQAPILTAIEQLRAHAEYNQLGAGEQESIALSLHVRDATLLCSDNRARRFARNVGVQVANIAAFLLACKIAGLLNVRN